jgi:hypothetical protein
MLPKLNSSFLTLAILLAVPGADLGVQSSYPLVASTTIPENTSISPIIAQATPASIAAGDSSGPVAVSPDGNTLVRGNAAGELQFWERDGNALGSPIPAHEGAVTAVAYSPDGGVIASVGRDGLLRFYDVDGNPSGDPIMAHADGATAIAYSPDGTLVATTGANGTVGLWDAQGNEQISPIAAHQAAATAIAFSPDGETLISGGRDGAVLLWDLEGNPVDTMQRRVVAVNSVAVNPDGVIATGNQDGTVLLWSYSDADEIYLGQPLEGHQESVTAISFIPEGSRLITADAGGTVRQWDLEGNPVGDPLRPEVGAIAGLAVAPDGTFAITGEGGSAQLWNPDGDSVTEPFGGAGTSQADGGIPLWLWLLPPVAVIGALLWWWLRRPHAVVETSTSRSSGTPTPDPSSSSVPTMPAEHAESAEPQASIPSEPPFEEKAEAEPSPLAARAESVVSSDRLAISGSPFSGRSHLSIEPHEGQILAQWDVPDVDRAVVEHQGGGRFAVRLYDVTGIDLNQQPAHSIQEVDCDEHTGACTLPVPAPDRDYLAEIGYHKPDGTWMPLTRSTHLRVTVPSEPSPVVDRAILPAAIGAALGAAAFSEEDDRDQATIEAAKYDVGQTDLSAEALADVDADLPDLPDGYGESRIVLLPRDPQMAYAYWDVPKEHREEVRRQGGQRFALRFYDVTDIDLNHQNPHSLQQYDADEMARDWYIPVPVSDRDYIAEVGYVTGDGNWLMLARSLPVHIPPVYPSDWYEEHFLPVNWDEDLRGKTLMTLVPPYRRSEEGMPTQAFTLAQSLEIQRIAGSIFGSQHQVPGSLFGSQQMVGEQAVSSYIFPSGVGMGAVPTVSGLTMSGVGFSASAPPIRSRKFWLVADAELIVYGATEPDATVTIGGRPITLNPDGTFRFQMSFQDGLIDYPIVAVASDGEQLRSIHMKFNRETPHRQTNTKEKAQDELY